MKNKVGTVSFYLITSIVYVKTLLMDRPFVNLENFQQFFKKLLVTNFLKLWHSFKIHFDENITDESSFNLENFKQFAHNNSRDKLYKFLLKNFTSFVVVSFKCWFSALFSWQVMQVTNERQRKRLSHYLNTFLSFVSLLFTIFRRFQLSLQSPLAAWLVNQTLKLSHTRICRLEKLNTCNISRGRSKTQLLLLTNANNSYREAKKVFVVFFFYVNETRNL